MGPELPKGGMAEAMRAALTSRSPSPACDANRLYNEMHAQVAVVNAQLDKEAAEEASTATPAAFLRQYNGLNNVGDFEAMVKFASTEWQMPVRWRNCTSHKERLSNMNLSDPKNALSRMAAEIQQTNIGRLDQTGPTGSTRFLHPASAAGPDPRSRYVNFTQNYDCGDGQDLLGEPQASDTKVALHSLDERTSHNLFVTQAWIGKILS